MRNQEKISNIIFVLSITLVGLSFYLLNVHFPLYLDDWVYIFAHEGKKSDSFLDIIQSEYYQYIRWGGRSVVHIIARSLLWFGETWGDILNTIAYILLVLLIYFITGKRKTHNIYLFFLINILIWFGLPDFSQNLLWITGSANYLWGCLLIYGFIFLYINFLLTKQGGDRLWKRLAMLLFGIIAGWTNENTGVALLFFLAGVLLYLKYKKEPVPQWMLYGLSGAIIGYAFMFLAPGNAIRSQLEFRAIHKLEEVPLSFYFYRFVTITKFSYVHLKYFLLIYAGILVIFLRNNNKSREEKELVVYLSLLFLCASGIATIVMSASPYFPERAWFGIIILLITSIVVLYANIDFSGFKLRLINRLSAAVLAGIYIFSFAESYSELLRFDQAYQYREKLVDEAIERGEKNIVIRDVLYLQKESPAIVLGLKDWMALDNFRLTYGHYKGVESITISIENVNDSR